MPSVAGTGKRYAMRACYMTSNRLGSRHSEQLTTSRRLPGPGFLGGAGLLECLGHRVWQWRWRIDRYAKGAYINNSTGLWNQGL